MDPTLFALPTAKGFSGEAWLYTPVFEYQPTNPPAPAQWLTLAQEDLGDDFAEFVQTNLVSEDLIAEQLNPTLTQIAAANPMFTGGTSLRIEGDLAGYAMQSRAKLPQAAEPALTNTVVRLAVDGSGRTVSAALLSACGTPRLDLEALEYARAAYFRRPAASEAAAEPGLAFGAIVFQWWRADGEKPGSAGASVVSPK
jgi:hypothetical protein